MDIRVRGFVLRTLVAALSWMLAFLSIMVKWQRQESQNAPSMPCDISKLGDLPGIAATVTSFCHPVRTA